MAALRDLYQIIDWIGKDDPEAARRVGRMILDRAETLPVWPLVGRKGPKDGTFEVVVARLPYILTYRIDQPKQSPDEPATIAVVRVHHGAMKRQGPRR